MTPLVLESSTCLRHFRPTDIDGSTRLLFAYQCATSKQRLTIQYNRFLAGIDAIVRHSALRRFSKSILERQEGQFDVLGSILADVREGCNPQTLYTLFV
jgi:hypothetical protein